MIGRILCSTGAFSRDPDRTDIGDILQFIDIVACDGFELIFYPSFYDRINELQSLPDQARGHMSSLHTEKSIGPLLGTGDHDDARLALERLRINAGLAQSLGVERLVLHLWGMPESDSCIERNLAYLEECAQIAVDAGCPLTVESIPCTTATPVQHLLTIAREQPHLTFTLDTEFLAAHDELMDALEHPEIIGRTEQIHIKDFGGDLEGANGKRVYLHPGEGQLDFLRVCERIAHADQEIDLCLESTSVGNDGSVDIESIRRDLEFLREMVAQTRHTHGATERQT